MFSKEIEFSAHEDYFAFKEDFPIPTKLNIPDWYKKLSHNVLNKTVKGCMPFLDTLTSGYLLKMPQDFYIRHNVDNKNEKGESFKDSFQTFGLYNQLQLLQAKSLNFNSGSDIHSIKQLEGSSLIDKNKNLPFYKIVNPWKIKTPKGYSCLFVPPLKNSDDRFSIIPGIGGLASKLGLSKWGAKALGEIGKKLSLGGKLTPLEVQVANKVAQNRQLIQTEMTKLGKSAAIKGGSKAVKTIAGYGAAGAGYSKGYDYVQRGSPKVKAETEGLDWNFVRSSFGSSGTKEENELLNKAWAKGWRPGQVVPKEFQTKQYQTQYSQDEKNINSLQQLIAQAK
jgi:hypothetical protein